MWKLIVKLVYAKNYNEVNAPDDAFLPIANIEMSMTDYQPKELKNTNNH